MSDAEKKAVEKIEADRLQECPVVVSFSLPDPTSLKDLEERVATALIEKSMLMAQEEAKLARELTGKRQEHEAKILKMKIDAEAAKIAAKQKFFFKVMFFASVIGLLVAAITTQNPIATGLIKLLSKLV